MLGKVSSFFILLIVFVFFISSCVTRKKVVYLEDKIVNDTISAVSPKYQIRSGDQLMIEIRSLDLNTNQYYNLNPEGFTDASLYLSSYIVNEEGKVVLPMGTYEVNGKTIEQITELIRDDINKKFKALVFVKLLGFEITVLGEVQRPGTYMIYGENVSILKAIGRAGDVTDYGNKQKVKLIRKEKDKYNVQIINLTTADFLTSENNFLMPGDILYVEPLRAKLTNQNLVPLRTIFIGISSLLIIIRLLRMIE